MNYDSYRLVPQYCNIKSRADVDTTVLMFNQTLTCPVIVANMSFCESSMCRAVSQAGAIGALHRFMTIEENVTQYLKVKQFGNDCFISIGVNDDSKERMQELYKSGARMVMIDIAHGDSIMMKEMVEWLRKEYDEKLFLIGGNIGTKEAMNRLCSWGCNGVKVGLSHGQVCTTKDVTGVSAGSVELLKEIVDYRDNCLSDKWVIADGGVRCIGDVCKAIAIGCDLVMSGFLFSKCYESATHGKYYGNASTIAMKKVKDENSYIPTPEGMEISVETQYSAIDFVKQIEGGLRSSMTYSNAKDMYEFRLKAKLVEIDK